MNNIINEIPLLQVPSKSWNDKFEKVIKDKYIFKKI